MGREHGDGEAPRDICRYLLLLARLDAHRSVRHQYTRMATGVRVYTMQQCLRHFQGPSAHRTLRIQAPLRSSATRNGTQNWLRGGLR
jgi:hypothetical protein